MKDVARLLLAVLLALPLVAADEYLFTSFRRNGETGVFFAISADGRQWTPVKGDQPSVKPEHSGMLMRDPWLGQGPDGTWHMLWTWGWTRKEAGGNLQLGYASSKDLIHWSAQRAIPVMQDEPTARNAWAPEAVWDPGAKEWIVYWSTTIPGRFPTTEAEGDAGYNHRVYAMTTKDWQTFTPAKLFFDPGFNCIDATIVKAGNRWILVFKDERKTPQVKRLRLAFADSPRGPWRDVTEPFTADWVEGPSVAQAGNEWFVYFDHYAKPQHYAALRTKDWKTFEPLDVTFPSDHRHGTVVRIPEKVATALRSGQQ
jgi:hypothetical protein